LSGLGRCFFTRTDADARAGPWALSERTAPQSRGTDAAQDAFTIASITRAKQAADAGLFNWYPVMAGRKNLCRSARDEARTASTRKIARGFARRHDHGRLCVVDQ
jgi:hypothetical protein